MRSYDLLTLRQTDPADEALKLRFGAELRKGFVDVNRDNLRVAFFKRAFQESHRFSAVTEQRVIGVRGLS